MSSKVINSVGIDIGTTTSQVIFSSLELLNTAAPTQVPRYEFVNRKILYESSVSFTPLNDDGSINHELLSELVIDEYKKAGFDIKEVETGAIIITGETSKAKNAKSTLMNLANDLGDFVVATAGPHLESVIAGRGSGSASYSENNTTTVINIDIGGGTSNYVCFKNGRVIDTSCVNVGGRLIQLDENGNVVKILPPAKIILKAIMPDYKENYTNLTVKDLRLFCDTMADLIAECLDTKESSPLLKELLMTDKLKNDYKCDTLFISGGVGECYYNYENYENDKYKFGDLGVMFAEALKKNSKLNEYNIFKPNQTIRATVIGAGTYTLSLSGSTIWLSADQLPIRNLPVIHPYYNWKDEDGYLSDEIVKAARRMDIDLSADDYAIYLEKDMPVTYKAVTTGAEELTKIFNTFRSGDNKPAIVLTYNDIGKVLGMELAPRLLHRPLAVIDEVLTYDGDYIDIGKSYFGGEIVPLTVKSLAFP
ncbi:MAG: ethanolamine ammonia-lyase reactivating factor EutA [Bacteroidetes bacterium]|nr:ethanolamine ammonia-lyase reactivating factor EutA [Bacteroidota bacterium]